MADEIRNKLSGKETGIMHTDLDSYISLTNSLISVDKRIGSSGNQGIISTTLKKPGCAPYHLIKYKPAHE